MQNRNDIYIDGQWVAPSTDAVKRVINPATEEVVAEVGQGDGRDVDRAVTAARRAFADFSRTTPAERAALIDRIIAAYEARLDAFAEAAAFEVGIPVSSRAQVMGPVGHMKVARDLVQSYAFEQRIGDTIIRREAMGVTAQISPWNWPIQTPVIKFIYALAAGCTSVIKPSDGSPLTALLLADVMHEAGVPAGVFNLVIGRGSVVGEAMASHPDVNLISFTGSTRAGIRVAEVAARTLKRTSLELGGKSANVVLPDAELEAAARWTIQRCFFNTGQSCHAPSRLFVPRDRVAEVAGFLADEVAKFRLGDPMDPATTMGPAASEAQFATVQRYIAAGIDAGAQLICGGPGRPEGLGRGFFVRPTVFAGVTPEMAISREEIFGPVLAVQAYDDVDDAVVQANASPYGLGGYVFARTEEAGYETACRIQAGRVCVNGAATNSLTPMGGYKQSGIGRSMGVFGLEEYLEVKSLYGCPGQAQGLGEIAH
jgi:aldehyde dehydrogenase (NAD+)